MEEEEKSKKVTRSVEKLPGGGLVARQVTESSFSSSYSEEFEETSSTKSQVFKSIKF